ncbi:MAG: HNH endonuclease [bacterium]|nr:HNH endonuclease [bacterium]
MSRLITFFRGIEFRSIDGGYFECSPGYSDIFNGTTLLHRAKWEYYIGSIPEGHELHHKNRIKFDCRRKNLELLHGSDHARLHMQERLKEGGDLHTSLSTWRKSSKGKKQLRVNMEKCRKNTSIRKLSCIHCGIPFDTKHPTKKYCSAGCQEAISGKIQKQCTICGVFFWTKPARTGETQTCGYKCGWELRRKNSV